MTFGLDKRSKIVKDFAAFSRGLVETQDIDPQFPVLKTFYAQRKLSKNDALWHSLIYLTYYHLGSAVIAWARYPKPGRVTAEGWPRLSYMRQRRLFRGNDFAVKHLNKALEVSDGDLHRWVMKAASLGGWPAVRAAFESLPYAGPWSSYKWCDIVKFVHDIPITGVDIGDKAGLTAGPIAGLSSLTKLSWQECAEDARIYQYLNKMMLEDFGVPLNGLDQLESCLCDWQSIIRGRYYIGHDIDRDLSQLQLINNTREEASVLYRIRERTFHRHLLGELATFPLWSGVRKNLNPHYKLTGQLVNI